jgi:hemerythrin HHE cation binding domain-containing protein
MRIMKSLSSTATLVFVLSCVAALQASDVVAQVNPTENVRHPEVHMSNATQIRIPESMRVEHSEIHAELVRATKVAGPVGAAAGELAKILHGHFVREEEIALPPLGLLAPLARGEAVVSMQDVLPMTDSLRQELPRMLEEHHAIRAATTRLRDVARGAGNVEVAQLTEKLALHAQSEEEIFYPAAILVGDIVRARLGEMAAVR